MPWIARTAPVWLAIVLLTSAFVAVGRPAGASSLGGTPPCYDGFQTLQQVDDSFSWQEPTLPFRTARWSGSVFLLARTDTNCQIAEVRVEYGGTVGGTLTLNGDLFASFTVQYPESFADYGTVSANAYGSLADWNPPAGMGPGYVAETNFKINARGADEYVIQGLGAAAAVVDLRASFRVPLALLGQTVDAQIHVGTNLCACSVTPLTLPVSPYWDVYVHAHEDDWQAWQSPNAVWDYQSGDSVLLVYTTAGDAGNPPSYWQAREDAAEASVHWLVPSGPSEGSGFVTVCYTADVAVCHPVWTRTYGRAVSVYLRAPDGGADGGGFPSTNYETLEKLRDGAIGTLTTVDGSTTYQGWADFTSTLAAVINAYAPPDDRTWVNAPDFDRDRQTTHVPGCDPCPDHADHLATADAVYDITVAAGGPWNRAWFIDYPLGYADPRYPANLDAGGYATKRGLFMAYRDALYQETGIDEYTANAWFWENAFNRCYGRVA